MDPKENSSKLPKFEDHQTGGDSQSLHKNISKEPFSDTKNDGDKNTSDPSNNASFPTNGNENNEQRIDESKHNEFPKEHNERKGDSPREELSSGKKKPFPKTPLLLPQISVKQYNTVSNIKGSKQPDETAPNKYLDGLTQFINKIRYYRSPDDKVPFVQSSNSESINSKKEQTSPDTIIDNGEKNIRNDLTDLPTQNEVETSTKPTSIVANSDVELPSTNDKDTSKDSSPSNVKMNIEECKDCYCKLKNMHPLQNVKIFVGLLSFLTMVQQALSSGYIPSIITTIQKQFGMNSYRTGIMVSMYNVGNALAVIFVSHLGTNRKITPWIAVGCLAMSLSSIIFITPNFIFPRWSVKESNNSEKSLCKIIDNSTFELPEENFNSLSEYVEVNANDYDQEHKEFYTIDNPPNNMPLFIFILSQIILGAGYSPVLTLGTVYIDDHVETRNSSLYIAIIYAATAFGPVLGFLLGGWFLTFNVDGTFTTDSGIDQNNMKWIGMWWGGFIMFAILFSIISVPISLFPEIQQKGNLNSEEKYKISRKRFSKGITEMTLNEIKPSPEITKESPKNISVTGHHETDDIEFEKTSNSKHADKIHSSNQFTPENRRLHGKNIKDLPSSIFKLSKNPVYMLTTFAACAEIFLVSGFVTFLPKYMETQFSITNAKASTYTGCIAIPGACIGALTGGYLIRYFQLGLKGSLQLIIIFNLWSLFTLGILLFLGCNNLKLAGKNVPYSKSTQECLENSSCEPEQMINITALCNADCNCQKENIDPVCGVDGITYISPCHAGCTSIRFDNFINCSCVYHNFYSNMDEKKMNISPNSSAVPGFCQNSCTTMIPFLIILFITVILAAMEQMPVLIISLRSVSIEERAFALGTQIMLLNLLAHVPGPIIIGKVIDSACLLWKNSFGGVHNGQCLLYDIEMFRYSYVGICILVKAIAALFFILEWIFMRKNTKNEYR